MLILGKFSFQKRKGEVLCLQTKAHFIVIYIQEGKQTAEAYFKSIKATDNIRFHENNVGLN